MSTTLSSRAGRRLHRRRARRDPQEVQVGGDRLRARGALRPGGEAGRLEPARDHERRHRRADRRARAAASRAQATATSRRRSASRSSSSSRRSASASRRCARDERELQRLLAVGAEKARRASEPTLEAMYDRMGFVQAERRPVLRRSPAPRLVELPRERASPLRHLAVTTSSAHAPVVATTRLVLRLQCQVNRDKKGELHEEARHCSCGRSRPRGIVSARRGVQVRRRESPQRRSTGSVVVPARQRRQARDQHRLRQRPLRAGQPERPVRSRADAAPAQLPEEQRHGVLELAHADDRAHRRRQPDDLHRPVRRPARTAAVELVQDVQPGRVDRSGDVVRLLDVADHRHEDDDPPVPNTVDTHAVDGGRRTAAITPGAVGAVHAGRLHGRRLLDREHGARERDRRRLRRCSARTRRRRRRRPRTPPTRSRTSRSPSTSARRSTAPRAPARSARSSTARRRRSAADRAGRLQRLPGAVRREVHRAGDRRRPEPCSTTATR